MAQFQSTVPNKLGMGPIGLSPAPLYTAPTSPPARVYVKDIDIAQLPGGSPLSVTVWLVPAGGVAGQGNSVPLIPGLVVQSPGLLQWTGSQLLLPGESIQPVASGPGLYIIASGGEAT
jgi:hypothetical protein